MADNLETAEEGNGEAGETEGHEHGSRIGEEDDCAAENGKQIENPTTELRHKIFGGEPHRLAVWEEPPLTS